MAKKKYYAVKNGKDGISAVFFSWEDCRPRVEGVPGAKYHAFSSIAEAEAFLRGETPDSPKKEAPPMPDAKDRAVAYVDGSFREDTGEFSCGAVLFWKGEKQEFSQKNSDPDMAQMRNVAGEIMGAVVVIRWCLGHNIPAVDLYHDYAGVGMWATGQWKTNKAGTQAYREFCRRAGEKISLRFFKVQAHSGDYWNDEADRLAKQALGI